jgi:hypothetical protein
MVKSYVVWAKIALIVRNTVDAMTASIVRIDMR